MQTATRPYPNAVAKSPASLRRGPCDCVNQFVQLVLDRLHLRLSRRIGNALAEQIQGRIHRRPGDRVGQLNFDVINQAFLLQKRIGRQPHHMTRSNSHVIVVPRPFFQPGYGLPVYRTTRPQDPPFLFFSGARYGGGQLVTNLPSHAAEKQKEKGCGCRVL
jgi:hypothetical protein